MYKKIIAAILAAALVLLCGCRGDDEKTPSDVTEDYDSKAEIEADDFPHHSGGENESDDTLNSDESAGGCETVGTDEQTAPAQDVTVAESDRDSDETGDAEDTAQSTATECTYEEYISMSPEQQQRYFKTFESVEAFVDWYNRAKEEYEKNHPSIPIGTGAIDVGNILG